MQTRRNYQAVFSRYGRGKVPETAISPQNRAEGLSGGAPKHCYVKYECWAESEEERPPHGCGQQITTGRIRLARRAGRRKDQTAAQIARRPDR